jgi:hypothetical protein
MEKLATNAQKMRNEAENPLSDEKSEKNPGIQ